MPELPEVETMRRGIAGICGSRIAGVVRPRCRLKPIAVEPGWAVVRRRCVGRQIAAVERIGKRVIARLDDRQRIVFEPRMTGLVLVADPPNRQHLRFGLELAGGSIDQLWFWDRRGLGSVRLVAEEEFNSRYGLDRIGPDPLQMTAQQMRERLGACRSAIKVALLDQRRIAGIGNLYASEILHVCGLHPARPAASLGRGDWLRLHAATVEVLSAAIRHEGSTLSDGTYRNALNASGGYQNLHRVYDKAGLPCPTCGGPPIVRVVQAQRSTFYCPVCQPSSRRYLKVGR